MGAREQAVIDFLHDGELASFVAACTGECIDRATFNGLSLPEGADPDELWEIVNGIRKMEGRPLSSQFTQPMRPGEESWVNETLAMGTALARIAQQTSVRSLAGKFFGGSQTQGLYLRPFVEEVAAALARDGYPIDVESLSLLIRGLRAPESDAERLILNACALVLKRDELAAEPLTVAAAWRIREALFTDAPVLSEAPLERLQMPNYRSDLTRDEILQSLEDRWAAAEAGTLHPVMAMISNADVIWQFRPFGEASALMELLLRVVFAARVLLPGLSFCPYGALCLKWERGELSRNVAPHPMNEQGFSSGFGRDVTFYFAQTIRFVEAGVAQLTELAEAAESRNGRLKRLVEEDWRLNYRQIDALRFFVENPDGSTDVRTYSENCGISLVTARADLQKLVDFDYLYRREEKGRVRYFACPDLALKIDGLAARS